MLLLIVALILPWDIAKVLNDENSPWLNQFQFVIDILFLTDVVINIFTVIYDDDGEWTDDRIAIIQQ